MFDFSLLLTGLVSIEIFLIGGILPANASHANLITIDGDSTPVPGSYFAYSGILSTSPSAISVSITIDWGDGNSETLQGFSVSYNSSTGHGNWGTFHSYASEGPRTITVFLRVPDPDGSILVATGSLNVNVQSVTEITTLSLSDHTSYPENIISASGTFRTGLGAQCVIVDWGDGQRSIVSGQNLSYDTITNSGTWSGAEHSYQDIGTFQVSAIQGGIDIDSQECITRGTPGTDTINIIAEAITMRTDEGRIIWGRPIVFFGTLTSASESDPCIVVDWSDDTSTTVGQSNIAIDLETGTGVWSGVSHSFTWPGLYSITARQGQMIMGVTQPSAWCATRGEPAALVVEVQPHESNVLLEALNDVQSGQMVSISGRLVDEDTGTGIPNVEIELTGSGVQSFDVTRVFTDNFGRFALQGTVPENATGQLEVRASFAGTALYSASYGIVSPNINHVPVANAGQDLTIDAARMVGLDGTSSYDQDPGTILRYLWTQIAGPSVRLSSAQSATPSFQFPDETSGTTITFSLVVNDGQLDSAPDFVSISLNVAPSLTMAVTKEPQQSSDRITVTGYISRVPSGSQAASLYLTGPSGSISSPIPVEILSDGSYRYVKDFSASDNGTWSARIVYGALEETRSFNISVDIGINPLVYLLTLIAVPIGIAVYKVIPKLKPQQGKEKSEHESKEPPKQAELYVSAGVEIEDAKKQENEGFEQRVTTTIQEPTIQNSITGTLSKSLALIKETLASVKQAAEFTRLCSEANRNPDEAFAEVANRGIAEMLAALAPIYGKFFIQDITVSSEIQILEKSKGGKRRIAPELDIKMRAIYPYIEVGLKINSVPTTFVRIMFRLDSDIKTDEAELLIGPGNKVEINLQDIIVSLQLSLDKIITKAVDLPIPIGQGERILNKPITLIRKDFKLSRLVTRDKDEGSKTSAPTLPKTEKGAKDVLRQIYCTHCSKQVKALRFCPECGSML